MRAVPLASLAIMLALAGPVGVAEEPQAPARLLVVSVTTGFRHGSIGTAEGVLEKLGRDSGLYHLDYLRMPPGNKNDPAWKERLAGQFARAFAPASLAEFDGVMFVSTTGELPCPTWPAFSTGSHRARPSSASTPPATRSRAPTPTSR